MALIRYNDSEFERFHGGNNLPGFRLCPCAGKG